MGTENKPNSPDLEIAVSYETQKDSFLEKRNWVSRDCEHCGVRFFSKKRRPDYGDISCHGNQEFLHDERKKKVISPVEINSSFQSFFAQKGFEICSAKSILNEDGTTLFTSAGVQILDDSVFRGKPAPEKPLLVSQPSLRTQYLDNINEGNSLSFVNICTEQANTLPEDHMKTLDLWLEFLSKQGLYMGDVTLLERKKEQQWRDLKVQSKIIAIYYKGLEIGDGNYDYEFNPHVPGVTSISDFGFGLERLTWIQRKDSYFDGVGPLNESLRGNGLIQELTKTLTLLAAYGLEPSNKDKGYRYRLFTKKIVDLTFPKYLNLPQLVNYYYQYWNHFVNFSTNANSTARSVQGEYERNYNKIIRDRLTVSIDPNCPTEEFLINLFKAGVSRDQLAQLLTQN